jgi:signal peptidase I
MRKLDPFFTFLACVAGFGYLYVGELWLGAAVILGVFLAHATLGWTGWIFQPYGIYIAFALVLVLLFLQWVLPCLIAWRKKEVPVKRYNRWYFYVVWMIGISIVLDLWASHNEHIGGYEIFRIPSEGMAPILQRGDWATADTWRYRKRDPDIGDVVTFSQDGLVFAKRIVGLPNDTVEIRNGVLFRNAQPVREPYLHVKLVDVPYGRDVSPLTLGPGKFYVLGDFRDNSVDSRRIGPIEKSQLLGRIETVCFAQQGLRVGWDRFPRVLVDDT